MLPLKTLKPFEYFEPRTIEDALKILSVYGTKAKVLAGGTDLLPSMKRRKIQPQYVVHINQGKVSESATSFVLRTFSLSFLSWSKNHELKVTYN